MNWHVFERVTTKMGILGLMSTGGVAAHEVLDALSKVPERWWVVIWMGGMTFLMLHWQRKQGRTAQRSPNGEVSRLHQALAEERDERKRLDTELKEERAGRVLLDSRVDKACERLARIEGDLHGLVAINGKE